MLVADIQKPIAFCYWRTHKAPVVTPALLEGRFSEYEIEAIVASLLAKQVLSPKMTITFGHIERMASDLAFSQSLLEEVKGTLGTNELPPLALLEDTWVVRLTGNPGALKSAIQISVALLQDKPVTVGQADPMVFVDPPHQFEYVKIDLPPDNIRYAGKYAYYCMVEDMGMLRDVLLCFRLRNLDMIIQGSRQPYQHAEQGAIITGPKGWK